MKMTKLEKFQRFIKNVYGINYLDLWDMTQKEIDEYVRQFEMAYNTTFCLMISEK